MKNNDKKIMKKSIFIILAVIVVAILFMLSNGYAFTESSALALSNKHKKSQIVYSKEFGDINLLVEKELNKKYLIELKKKWFLYKVTNKEELLPSGTDKMKRTWISVMTKHSNRKYETIIAAEILDPHVKKVIVSNDDMLFKTQVDIKKASTFFKELEVDNGYAVYYTMMDFEDASSFIFRLIDESGNIIYTGRWLIAYIKYKENHYCTSTVRHGALIEFIFYTIMHKVLVKLNGLRVGANRAKGKIKITYDCIKQTGIDH